MELYYYFDLQYLFLFEKFNIMYSYMQYACLMSYENQHFVSNHLCAHHLLTCLHIVCNMEHLKWSIIIAGVRKLYLGYLHASHNTICIVLCACKYTCNIICWLRGKLLHPNQAKKISMIEYLLILKIYICNQKNNLLKSKKYTLCSWGRCFLDSLVLPAS